MSEVTSTSKTVSETLAVEDVTTDTSNTETAENLNHISMESVKSLYALLPGVKLWYWIILLKKFK